MKLSKQQVRRIAELSRLCFTEQEVAKFQRDLIVVLEYVDKLLEVDVEGVEETSQTSGLTNVTRADEPDPFVDIVGIMRNAPATYNRYYRTKKIL